MTDYLGNVHEIQNGTWVKLRLASNPTIYYRTSFDNSFYIDVGMGGYPDRHIEETTDPAFHMIFQVIVVNAASKTVKFKDADGRCYHWHNGNYVVGRLGWWNCDDDTTYANKMYSHFTLEDTKPPHTFGAGVTIRTSHGGHAFNRRYRTTPTNNVSTDKQIANHIAAIMICL